MLLSDSSSSPSEGAGASGSEGSLCVADTVHRIRTQMKRFVSSELNWSTSRALPTWPDEGGSSRAIVEAARAAESVARVIQFGSLGSLVAGNLVPPISTGTLRLVRGILNLASPRFGIMMMAASPRVMTSSGRRSWRSIPSSSEVMASPPRTALHRPVAGP